MIDKGFLVVVHGVGHCTPSGSEAFPRGTFYLSVILGGGMIRVPSFAPISNHAHEPFDVAIQVGSRGAGWCRDGGVRPRRRLG